MHKVSDKRPVLTSPWKIGMLVALLVTVVGFGVGYYVVNVYGVDLKWLKEDSGSWGINSYMFFKENYPVMAGVILVSLFSYFIVASGVRRYKFYLNSGQDYRKMVALADSVDDLTNPTQIAKLSDYPELQNVLRNYGDQIREISQELDHNDKEQRSIDLEMEIDSLLRGESVQEMLVEGKWWAPIFKKVEGYIKDTRSAAGGLEMQNEVSRGILSQAVLSNGKVMESVSDSDEDLLEIVRAAGELNSLVQKIEEPGCTDPAGAAGTGGNISLAIVAEMEDSLQKLEQGGRVLDEFSEDSNGLALNMALTAARGGIGERELAQYAEKARSVAERFKNLGSTFSGITRDMLGSCNKIRERMGSDNVAGNAGHSQIRQYVSNISERIENRTSVLQRRICSLKNELGDVNELLQDGLKKFTATMTTADGGEESRPDRETVISQEPKFVNLGADAENEPGVDSDLVINHGRLWEENDSFGENCESTLGVAGEPSHDGVEEGIGRDGEKHLAFGDVRDNDPPVPQSAEAAEEPFQQPEVSPGDYVHGEMAKPDSGIGLMKMPGHKWIKIDVEKGERGDDKGDVDVRTADKRNEITEDSPAGFSSAPDEAKEKEQVMSRETVVSEEADGAEPVYDLFEIGAVEYVEEPQH